MGGCNITGPFTFACVYKKNADGIFHALVENHVAGGAASAPAFEIRSTNTLTCRSVTGATGAFSTTTFLVADGWLVLVATKAGGTATPRFHFKKQAALGMTHENADKTNGDPASQAGGAIKFGVEITVDRANGKLAFAAEWNVELTDVQCEELVTEAGWLNNTGGAPVGLWRFNTNPVLDLAGGGADEFTRTGTALVGLDDPPGFFNIARPTRRMPLGV